MELPTDFKCSKIYLKAITFRGIPTQNGFPENLFYSIVLPQHEQPIHRTDHLQGIPIQLSSFYQASTFENPLFLANAHSKVGKFKIDIQDETGAPATFEEVAMWLKMD